MPTTEVDLEHVMACVDPHCGYCNDVPKTEEKVSAFLEAMVALPEAA